MSFTLIISTPYQQRVRGADREVCIVTSLQSGMSGRHHQVPSLTVPGCPNPPIDDGTNGARRLHGLADAGGERLSRPSSDPNQAALLPAGGNTGVEQKAQMSSGFDRPTVQKRVYATLPPDEVYVIVHNLAYHTELGVPPSRTKRLHKKQLCVPIRTRI